MKNLPSNIPNIEGHLAINITLCIEKPLSPTEIIKSQSSGICNNFCKSFSKFLKLFVSLSSNEGDITNLSILLILLFLQSIFGEIKNIAKKNEINIFQV